MRKQVSGDKCLRWGIKYPNSPPNPLCLIQFDPVMRMVVGSFVMLSRCRIDDSLTLLIRGDESSSYDSFTPGPNVDMLDDQN